MNVMLPLTTFGIAILSALCPLVNLELYIAGVGAFGPAAAFWPLVATAAAGQTIGKIFWFQVGRSSLRWSYVRKKTESPRWKNQLDNMKRRTERRPWLQVLLVLASATVGLPPMAIMAVLSGQLNFNRWTFVAMTLVGRTVRFSALVGGVSWFRAALPG